MKLIFAKGFSFFSCLLALVAVLISGCATNSDPMFTSDPAVETVSQPAAGAASNQTTGATVGTLRFKKGDLVIISFSGSPDLLPNHEERIKEDGKNGLSSITSQQITLARLISLKTFKPGFYDVQVIIKDNVANQMVSTDKDSFQVK